MNTFYLYTLVAVLTTGNLTQTMAAAKPGKGAKADASRNPRFEPEYKACVFPSESASEEKQLKYGWLTPLNQKPGEKYPLVICLHGSGGSVGASAPLARAAMREKYPAFVMVPKADRPFCWAKTDVIKRAGAPEEGYPEKYPVLIEAIRTVLKTEPIDPARVYITGQSMGGVGSWGALARNPELFAAAVPVCGARSVADVPKMTSVAVWAFHGEKDPTVPVHFSRDLTQAIKKAGGTARYTEYPGVGHNSWTQAYGEAEMWAWLFAQKKSAK